MVTKKTNNRPNSNFRQQDSTARKLETNYDTAAQKQFAQTATVIEGTGNQQKTKGKLQKQYTEQTTHSENEFRQQENTASKIVKTLETNEQQQLSRSASTLIDNSSGNNSSFINTDQNKGKLQKKFSNEVREEFRQQENTASKIVKTLETNEQQQLSRSASALIDNSSENNSGFANSNPNKGKLQKKFSNEARQEFRQQENTTSKLDKVLQTEAQQQFAQSASKIEGNESNHHKKLNNQFGTADNLQKGNRNFKQRNFKLHKEVAKGSLSTLNNNLKNGVQKYQKELEKDDEAVKFTSQGITQTAKTAKLTTNAIRKLREKKLESANLKKAKTNPLYKEKPKESSLKKISKTPVTVLKTTTKSGVQKYQNELEQGDVGVKLASQGATQISRATKKLTKGVAKIDTKAGKLGKQGTKLTQFRLNKSKNLKSESKKVLQKKKIKRKIYYAPKNKKKAFAGAMTSFSHRIGDLFKNLANFNRMIVTRVLGAKVAAVLGSGLAAVLPLIIVAALVLVIVGVMGGSSTQNQPLIGSKNLSPEVEQWRSLVETEAAAQGMEKYVNLILAIIQVETGGKGTADIMQSSESAGYAPGYWSTEIESIRQGIKHLKNIVNMVTPFGLQDDYKLLAQAYNFGSYFATYVGNLGGVFSLDIAEQYSRTVVAPSLGNHSGETYSYVNATSTRLGKTYLYRNGGNYLYAELVAEYLGGAAGVTGDFALVVAELEKYLGWEYVWGGKNPSTGFDCSGFVSWGLQQIGIELPSYAASQYDLTVPIDPSEAQPGDLIFFKGTYGGPNHVSHVGFYIDENTMLDSNGSGVGYHNWKDSYWQSHYAGIHRVVR